MKSRRHLHVLLVALCLGSFVVVGCGKKAPVEEGAPVSGMSSRPATGGPAPAIQAPGNGEAAAAAPANAEAAPASPAQPAAPAPPAAQPTAPAPPAAGKGAAPAAPAAPAAQPKAAPAAAPASGQIALGDLQKRGEKLRSYIMTSEGGRGMNMTQAVMYEKGAPVKMRMALGENWTLMDFKKKTMYQYVAQEQKAYRIPLEGDRDMTRFFQRSGGGPGRVPGMEPTTVLTRAETVDGVKCWVIEVPAPPESKFGGMTIWMDDQWGLTRQTKMGEVVMKFRYSKINAVPASEFALPRSVKVEDLPAEMKGMMGGFGGGGKGFGGGGDGGGRRGAGGKSGGQ